MIVWRNSFSAAGVALLMSAAVGTAGVAADPDPARMSQLVRELNAGSRTVRETAERGLIEAGPAALPAIVAARATAHGEAAFRLRSIQRTLEAAAAQQTVEEGLATIAVQVARAEPVGSPPRAVRLVLRAAWQEPLEPVAIRLPLVSIVAEGPAGEAMPVAQRGAVVEPALPSGATTVELPVVLTQPDHPLESLALLRGTLRLWLAGRAYEFLLPLDDGRRSMTVARATVRVEEVAIRDGRLLVSAQVAYDAPTEGLASHRTWLAQCPFAVVGDDGRPLEVIDQTTTARSEQGLTTRGTFALPPNAGTSPRGWQLRWRLPMAIHEVPFDFALRGLPLPAHAP